MGEVLDPTRVGSTVPRFMIRLSGCPRSGQMPRTTSRGVGSGTSGPAMISPARPDGGCGDTPSEVRGVELAMRRKCATVAAVVMLLFTAAPSSAVAACWSCQRRFREGRSTVFPTRDPEGPDPRRLRGLPRAVRRTLRTGSETAPPPPPGSTSQRYRTIVAYLTAKRPCGASPARHSAMEPAAGGGHRRLPHPWTAVHAQSNIVTGHRIHALHIDVARRLLDLVNDEELPPRFGGCGVTVARLHDGPPRAG